MTTITATTVTTTVPFSKLILSDINVRKRIPERHVEAIAASIAEHGLIHPLVVGPATPKKTKYAVHAGGLRWRAIGQLIEAGTLPRDHAVEVKVYGDEAAALREISLIENLMREAMAPADECRAYRDIIADGVSVEDVARRFSVTVRHVNGRLRLADLAGPIFDALSEGRITLDAAIAYGSTGEHSRQLSVWENIVVSGMSHNPDAIRRAIASTTVRADDPVALLVGEADYTAAGGRIERDLFAAEGEGRWIDGDLVREMATKRLTFEAEVAALGTKLGWIKPLLTHYVGSREIEGLHRYYPRYEDPSPEAQARIAEIIDKLAELELESDDTLEVDEHSGDHSEYDRIEVEMDKLAQERDTLSRGAEIIPDEDRPHVGTFLILGRDGAAMLWPDYYTSAKPRPATSNAASGDGAAGTSPDQANDPAGDALPRSLEEQLAKDRRDVLALHVASDPRLALDLAIFSLARELAGHLGYDRTGCSIRITDRFEPAGLKDIPQATAELALAGIREGLETSWARESNDFASFLAFRELDEDMKAGWLAYAVSQSLQASLLGGPRDNRFQSQLGALIGIDMAQHWRPGAERFFDRMKKSSILSILGTIDPTMPGRYASSKKTDLASAAAKLCIVEPAVRERALAWVPSVLCFSAPARAAADLDDGGAPESGEQEQALDSEGEGEPGEADTGEGGRAEEELDEKAGQEDARLPQDGSMANAA